MYKCILCIRHSDLSLFLYTAGRFFLGSTGLKFTKKLLDACMKAQEEQEKEEEKGEEKEGETPSSSSCCSSPSASAFEWPKTGNVVGVFAPKNLFQVPLNICIFVYIAISTDAYPCIRVRAQWSSSSSRPSSRPCV